VYVYLAPSPDDGRLRAVRFGPQMRPGWKPPRRVPPLAPLAERFWSRVNKNGPTRPGMTTPCWEWTGYRLGGYAAMRRGGRGSQMVRASHIAWEVQTGEQIPAGLFACHRCDNPACVRAEPGGAGHIFPGTHQDNMDDMVGKGRHRALPGERNGCAKLTEADVAKIRGRAAAGEGQRALAAAYGVSRSLVSAIVCRARWSHVP
jgi:hypothetical protein